LPCDPGKEKGEEAYGWKLWRWAIAPGILHTSTVKSIF
jgi:hypothetical protein